jgi:hypothetical protein
MSTQTVSSRSAQASVKANLTRHTTVTPRPAATAKRPSFLDLLMRALGSMAA